MCCQYLGWSDPINDLLCIYKAIRENVTMKQQLCLRPLLLLLCLGTCLLETTKTYGQLSVAEFSDAIASSLASEIPSNGNIHFFIDGKVFKSDLRDQAVSIADEQLARFIAAAMNNKKALGGGNNKYVLVEDREKASLIIHGIRLKVEEPGVPIELSAKYEIIDKALGGQGVRTLLATIAFEPLIESTKIALATEPQRIQRLPLDAVAAPDGGFGVQVLVEGKVVPAKTSSESQISTIAVMKNGDVFQLKLINDFKCDAVAYVRVDGEPQYSIADVAIPALVPKGDSIVIAGWNNNTQEGNEFKLSKLAGPNAHDQHIEVRFHFASMDQQELLAMGSPAGQRGYRVERGNLIRMPIQIRNYFLHPTVVETVRIVFED